MGWVGGLTLDFRPTLPVVTHDRGSLGKNGSVWGYVLLFGGSDGEPHGPRLLIWGPW